MVNVHQVILSDQLNKNYHLYLAKLPHLKMKLLIALQFVIIVSICFFNLIHCSTEKDKKLSTGSNANSTALAITGSNSRQLIVLDTANDIEASPSELKASESHHHHSHHKKHHKKHHKSK